MAQRSLKAPWHMAHVPSATHTPYVFKVVHAQELRDVLDGRITG